MRLEVEGLSIEGREGAIASNIRFSLVTHNDEQRSLALIGPSGAGKSSILRALMALCPTGFDLSGKVALSSDDGKNKELFNLPSKGLELLRGAVMTLVPQDAVSSLDPTRTVAQQLSEVRKVRSQKKLPEWLRPPTQPNSSDELRRAGLPASVGNLFSHQLSGGMAKRVAFALALACQPSILLIDEPSAGLDRPLTFEILESLGEEISQNKQGLILVTHDLQLAAQVCNQVLLIDNGSVVEKTAMRTFVEQPQSALGKAMVASLEKSMPTAYESSPT